MVTIFWIKEHYFICSVEEWNRAAKVYNVAVTAGLVTDDGELTPPIAPNVGFFKEQIDEDSMKKRQKKRKKSKLI